VTDSQPLFDVAVALADRTAVDWKCVAQSITNEEDRHLLAELRFIAGMVRTTPGDSSGLVTAVAPGASPKPPVAPLETGSPVDSWGPLRIIEHVGRGTFGDVYRAWDSRLDREVALKILRHRERDDEVRASTVIQEGRLLARVRHPNVVTVYGAERVSGQVGVWMEFIHGKTLEQELRDQGPFDVDRVIRIGSELANALSTVHRAGLIHGDVKTHNVMCERDGRLVLTDFGAGCELEETPDDQARELAGTPVCVAPEVLAGQAATPQSDVYSLGVLLYHLVTGTYPVRGRSLKEVREAHADGRRTPLDTARPNLPSAFVDIIDRALDPNPDNRYDSPDALGAELASLVSGRVGDSAASAIRTGRRWRYIAIAAVLTVAAGFGSVPPWWTSETPTIAVLPFKNLSAEGDSEYFVDGLTGEIIRNLSVIEGLEVRSLTSSFMFKSKPRNVHDVGQQLRANLIVEGSVLRADGRLRINAQLVRAADDTPLWSGRFDRELKDIFAVQDEISRSIVNELRLKLGRGQRRYNTSLEAYELYLKARALVDPHGGVPAARLAVKLFEQVVAMEPAFAPAHAGIADGWATMSFNSFGAAADEAYAKMRPAAEKAIQLDPLLAEAHAARGAVLARDRNWADSEAAFQRALALNRNIPTIKISFAVSTLFPQGKVERAEQLLEAALREDPLPSDVRRNLAWVQVSAGHYDEAIENSRRVLAADPTDVHTQQVLGRALFHSGDKSEAIGAFERLGQGNHGFLGYAYAATGRRSEAETLAAQRKAFPASLVLIHTGLGEKDRAFEALERMAAEKDPRVGIYLTYPELAFLRADPRMTAFRRSLGLSSEALPH
jgi:serine/threonine protein kinase/tetratricopeptide (TPR) repeat protein